jgi:hypothetical protein
MMGATQQITYEHAINPAIETALTAEVRFSTVTIAQLNRPRKITP